MPEQNEDANNTKQTLKDAVSGSAAASSDAQASVPATSAKDVLPEVAKRIEEAQNILIALSSGPSVDELASAIGLSMILNKMGKHATAIYSGQTPNALAFLKPSETFENNVDSLQDFVIALSKDKADHLRYKLDGDFVKIYITPYRTKIAVDDLDCSYGDFNVDLVIALNVMNGVDLDDALREYGRIMHDASVINITTNKPGNFGEIEWSDQSASSVSEIVAKLAYGLGEKVKLSAAEATAILTGIVAATEKFSNAKTTADAMMMVSKLMDSGANQQLVSKNIASGFENEFYGGDNNSTAEDDSVLNTGVASTQEPTVQEQDSSNLAVTHGNENVDDDSSELDLKSVEENLTNAPMKESSVATDIEPVILDGGLEGTTNTNVTDDNSSKDGMSSMVLDATQTASSLVNESATSSNESSEKGEKIIQPSTNMSLDGENENSNKYGQMLEEALMESDASVPPQMPTQVETVSTDATLVNPAMPEAQSTAVYDSTNPATMSAPVVPSAPEINGVPEINYAPMPGDQVLPPPPTPPIDMNQMPSMESASMAAASAVAAMPQQPMMAETQQPVIPQQPMMTPSSSVGNVPDSMTLPQVQMPAQQPMVMQQPIMQQPQPQVVAVPQQQASSPMDPGAFKIPGM